jgi:hypothetical protein
MCERLERRTAMTHITAQRTLTTVLVVLAGLFGLIVGTGCDDYVAAGDFYDPYVQPADFSPYGYDYDMYDLFTEDI